MHDDTVTVGVLLAVSILVPGVIVFAVSMLLIPGPGNVPQERKRALSWRRKLWEWNVGWMGLGFSLAGSFMVTEGLKDLYGKPRPDLLARCIPNLDNVAQYVVGGVNRGLDIGAPVIVDRRICQQTDRHTLDDGFASFPSGHSSFAFAGLLYLSLFLAAKLAVGIPWLSPSTSETRFRSKDRDDIPQQRNTAAAPPLPALIVVFLPIATALFITASRWFDNRHHGFDIISGSLIGIFFAWLGFRWYHLPVRRGAGWAWGARGSKRGFWIGVGEGGWGGDEGRGRDVEQGVNGDDRGNELAHGEDGSEESFEMGDMRHGLAGGQRRGTDGSVRQDER